MEIINIILVSEVSEVVDKLHVVLEIDWVGLNKDILLLKFNLNFLNFFFLEFGLDLNSKIFEKSKLETRLA